MLNEITAITYLCNKILLLSRRISTGNARDINNPLCWVSITLNLPGSLTFSLTLTRVMVYIKLNLPGSLTFSLTITRVMVLNSLITNVTGDVNVFVNHYRVSGLVEEHCWQIGYQIVVPIQCLGIKYAPHNVRLNLLGSIYKNYICCKDHSTCD